MSALESLFASMTLADLARLAGTTVAQVVEVAYSGRPSAAPSSTPKATKPGKVARGGLSSDQVLAALRAAGASAKLEDVRAKTGGSVPQVRAALQKLAGAKKVKITGQRRGTRYTAS
jgi:hypothetical protein